MGTITFLQRFDIAAGEGDANTVNGNLCLHRCLTGVFESLQLKKMKTVKTVMAAIIFNRSYWTPQMISCKNANIFWQIKSQ